MVETDRIRLMKFTGAQLLALIEDAEQYRALSGLTPAQGLREFFTSGEVSPVWLDALRSVPDSDPWLPGFGVIDRDSGLVVGSAGFKGPPIDGVVELAYGIVPSFEGRGYATEVAKALLAYAFGSESVRLVCAHTLPTPNASTRVLTKSGFTFVGDVTDPEDGPVWRWERPRTRDHAPTP